MTDLVSLVVTVRPPDPVRLPAHTGKAIYAQLLRWLADADPDLAKHWHDSDGPKPYTASSLVGGRRITKGQREFLPTDDAWFRLTALEPTVAAVWLALCEHPPEQVEVDGVEMAVTGLTTDPDAHPWAGSTSYNDLAAPYLTARDDPQRAVRLRFVSATAFRQSGKQVPMPLPDLVFGGLADRWNAYSPIAISPHIRDYSRESLALSHYDLRSGTIVTGDGRSEIGAIGSARYVATRYDRYWMSMIALMGQFAFYSGVGRLTTIGMGQTRPT